MLLVVAFLVIGTALSFGAFRVLVAAQDVSRLDDPLPAPTVIYDFGGKEASRISLNKIEPVRYEELPQMLIDAVVAVEDKRFFEHDGMDLRGMARALVTDAFAGAKVQGGSTITQQLAKNVFLSRERTWKRKWDEALLARKIEQQYSKPQIMTMYLNQIYFGEGAWGIKRAAAVYFGKEPAKLTLPEAALLAGLVKAPSALTPYKHPDQAKERRNLVLQLMKEQGYISAQAYAIASKEPIKLRDAGDGGQESGIQYPYYVDEIIREAGERYGLSENDVLHGGLRIYTALDPAVQQAAEKVYADDALFPKGMGGELVQSGAALVDPRDGGIRALVGGRGKQPFRGFNRAVQLKRQPGSAMKPIAVYTPALEQGYKPTDTVLDEPVDFGGYAPKNAGGTYHGEVTLQDALVNSYNVPAVKLLDQIGIDAGMEAAARFGIPLTDADRTLGLALGGLQEGVSPLQMAEAFGAFANDGRRLPAHTIVRIEAADGTVLAEAAGGGAVQATSADVARTMTAMMEGVVSDGTGEAAELDGRPVAGKTGTTQMPGTGGDGAKDNWFVGYTPQLVCSVWLGYDQSDASHYLTTTSKAAAEVFHALMTAALQGQPVMEFPKASLPGGGKPSKEDKTKDREDGGERGRGGKKQDDKHPDDDGPRDDTGKGHGHGRGHGKDKD